MVKKLAENLPFYFRGVSSPDGTRRLLAQRVGKEEDFHGPVFTVEWNEGEPVLAEEVGWLDDLALYGTQPLRVGEKELYGRLIPHDERLQALSLSGERLWKSAEPQGGRDRYIPRPNTDGGAKSGGEVRCFFLPARVELAPQGALLVPVNEGSRTFACNRSFNRSRVVAYAWDGFSFAELWHTAEQSGYLSDFAVGDADNDGVPEMVQAVIYSSGWFAKDSAALLVVELP